MKPHASILAIGTAYPSFRMSRAEWLSIADSISPPEVDRRVLERLADRSGIDTRRCAAFEDGRHCFYRAGEEPGTAARMALWSRAARVTSVEAARSALGQAAVDRSAVTHVVTASCTGFEAPGIDAHLIEALGLARDVRRLHVGFMGCHAAINALAAARAIVLAEPDATVLVCCVEVSSAHFHHSSRLDRLIANTLFADGAAALVVAARGGDGAAPELLATRSILLPDTHGEMGWVIGDHGFEMTLGARVPELLEKGIGAWVADALSTCGLETASVGAWAIHPGGPRVIDAVCSALALDPEAGAASRAVLREFGNMSSVTLPCILARLLAGAAPRPWVGLAFGPGLVGELVILR